MKSIFTIFCVVSFFFAKAQDSTIGLSKFEQLATMPGKFYNVEEKFLGNMRSRNFTVIKIKEVDGSEGASVLRIAPRPWSDSIVPVISHDNLYFNKDDLTEVVKNITFYSDEIRKNNASLNSYFLFVTPTDVKLSYRKYEGFSNDIYIEISKLRLFTRTVVSSSTVTFRKKDIDGLLDLFKTAITQM